MGLAAQEALEGLDYLKGNAVESGRGVELDLTVDLESGTNTGPTPASMWKPTPLEVSNPIPVPGMETGPICINKVGVHSPAVTSASSSPDLSKYGGQPVIPVVSYLIFYELRMCRPI